ncbi:MAG TPA: DNA cytosine methyltransferase [Planctomycetaceae bacterium]|nr:DNA cytosine methyltransferase [Planctomycetaceae bacterium]
MKYRYVSLFSGAGGLDIGLERVGLEPVSLCEIEKVFCNTLSSNQAWKHTDGHNYLSSAKILNADIREVSPKDLISEETIDLVVGGPPCQAFSSSGNQLSVLDPRGALVSEFYRIVDALRPKMFLFENVRGLVTARDKTGEPGGVVTELIHILEEIGYSCRAALLNSADYGSHQRRVRCFIVGSRNGEAPDFPEPKFQKQAGLFGRNWRSLEEFLSSHADADEANFTFPGKLLAEQLQNIPNGSGIKSPGKAEATRPSGHWGYRQGTFVADLSLPARTVTGSASQDWVRWDGVLRRLTFNEVKQLQGFPEDWIVEGTKSQQYKQIGNAVPTVFGEAIGRVIVSHLTDFPSSKAVRIGVPLSFRQYMEYTKKDHARNKASRTVHHQFNETSE